MKREEFVTFVAFLVQKYEEWVNKYYVVSGVGR